MKKIISAFMAIAFLSTIVTMAISKDKKEVKGNTPTVDQVSSTTIQQDKIGDKIICPVMKKKFKITKRSPKYKHEGKTYFFCCNSCLKKFKKNPKKYIKPMMPAKKRHHKNSNYKKEYKQAKIGDKIICPVMKTKFKVTKNSPKYSYKGKTYFFCCADCVGKFKKNPNKYIKSMKAKKMKSHKDCKMKGKKNRKNCDMKDKKYHKDCDMKGKKKHKKCGMKGKKDHKNCKCSDMKNKKDHKDCGGMKDKKHHKKCGMKDKKGHKDCDMKK